MSDRDEEALAGSLSGLAPLVGEIGRMGLMTLTVINVLNLWVIVTDLEDGRRRWLLVEGEMNPMTWFSVAVALAAAVMALLCLRIDRSHRRSYWVLVACVLVFISFDDATGLHERMGNRIATEPGWADRGHLWVLPWLVGAAAVVVALWRARPRLPARVRRQLVLGGGIFLLAAGGMELAVAEMEWGVTKHLLSTIEENAEVGGLIVILRALWGHAVCTAADPVSRGAPPGP